MSASGWNAWSDYNGNEPGETHDRETDQDHADYCRKHDDWHCRSDCKQAYGLMPGAQLRNVGTPQVLLEHLVVPPFVDADLDVGQY